MVIGGPGWLDESPKASELLYLSASVGSLLTAVGFSGSGSWLSFVGGSDMSVLVVLEWLEMIWNGRMEVRKMVACKFSITPAGGFPLLFRRWWDSPAKWQGTG